MLSLFPSLLTYQQVSPLMIRVVLALVLLYWAYKGFRDGNQSSTQKAIDIAGGLVGILLFIGLWTQGAALVAAIGLAVCLIMKIKSRSFLTNGVNYTFILFILSISLLVTGAGAWAYDLPL